ncbi:MAG: hypothetical protein WCO98_15845, partial [bacterium]
MKQIFIKHLMLTVFVIAAITTCVTSVYAQEEKPPIEGYIGVGMPSGDDVSNQYGGLWLNLGAKYTVSESDKLTQKVFLDVSAGAKDTDFTTSNFLPATVTARARVISLGYEATMVPNEDSPFYAGVGAALGFVSNESDYDAGSGYQWRVNGVLTGKQHFIFDNNQMKFIPHLLVGYQINDKSGIEAKYRFINAKLPANNVNEFSSYPSANPSTLSGMLTIV